MKTGDVTITPIRRYGDNTGVHQRGQITNAEIWRDIDYLEKNLSFT
jgi:hypothetical protein